MSSGLKRTSFVTGVNIRMCDWCEYKDACPKFNSEQTVCKRIDEQKELKKKLKS
jgi:hypothetical protein